MYELMPDSGASTTAFSGVDILMLNSEENFFDNAVGTKITRASGTNCNFKFGALFARAKTLTNLHIILCTVSSEPSARSQYQNLTC